MPFIPDVHTDDQISSSGWGNLIRNSSVLHFANRPERDAVTGLVAQGQLCYVDDIGEFDMKGPTSWLQLLGHWHAYQPVAFVATGGTGFVAYSAAGGGIPSSNPQLSSTSSAQYRIETNTCHFHVAINFGAGTPLLPQGLPIQVYLPDFQMDPTWHNTPGGQGNAWASWSDAGVLHNKWMGGGCFVLRNPTLTNGQFLFNGAYIVRPQEDLFLGAQPVKGETGGAGYVFPGTGPAGELSSMNVFGSFKMPTLAPAS
jgi:hypothetical protein